MVNTPLPVNALNSGEQGSFVTIARFEGSEMKVCSSFPRKRGRESVACATREIWQELDLN